MKGNEIISMLPTAISTVEAVGMGIFSLIFYRGKISTSEFEKWKTKKLGEIADELLDSGLMTPKELYETKNFSSICEKADKLYKQKKNSGSKDKKFNFDWFIRFYEAVGDIGDEEMQDIWAKILADEVRCPGNYSLRTIETLKNLTATEAKVFQKISKYALYSNKHLYIPNEKDFLDSQNIPFEDLMKLEDCGLLRMQPFLTITSSLVKGISNCLLANTKKYVVIASNSSGIQQKIELHIYSFTEAGKELYKVANTDPDKKFIFEYAKYLANNNPTCEIELHDINLITDEQIQFNQINLLEKDR